MPSLTKLLIPLFAGTLFLNSCGNENQKLEAQENKKDTTTTITNIGEALDYHLKFTAIKAYEQYRDLDSLENLYDSLDKKSDTLVSFWKKKIYN